MFCNNLYYIISYLLLPFTLITMGKSCNFVHLFTIALWHCIPQIFAQQACKGHFCHFHKKIAAGILAKLKLQGNSIGAILPKIPNRKSELAQLFWPNPLKRPKKCPKWERFSNPAALTSGKRTETATLAWEQKAHNIACYCDIIKFGYVTQTLAK